jgi:hypothetical protein
MRLSFPARHVRRDAFCGGRASSPSVEMQLLAFSHQLSALSCGNLQYLTPARKKLKADS